LMRVKKGIQTKRRATPALATLNCIMHSSILNILQGLKLKVSCLHRIFRTPLKLLYISFGSPKIFRLDLEFSSKIKNRNQIIASDTGLKILPLLCGFLR